MISEEQQDQAALYALDALDEAEASAFEASMRSSAELRELVAELREAAGDIALLAPPVAAPREMKAQVMSRLTERTGSLPVESERTRSLNWMPWAIAAALTIFCGMLALDRSRLQRDLAEERAKDPLAGTTLVALAPAAPAPPDAKATVAWEPDAQSGVIRITNLPAAGAGKDYQLWVVDADHTDPINAGILRIDANGVAQVRFKADVAAKHVKAFAVSLERAGGVPKKEGPIVLVGNA